LTGSDGNGAELQPLLVFNHKTQGHCALPVLDYDVEVGVEQGWKGMGGGLDDVLQQESEG
jgi:hypothetical protein